MVECPRHHMPSSYHHHLASLNCIEIISSYKVHPMLFRHLVSLILFWLCNNVNCFMLACWNLVDSWMPVTTKQELWTLIDFMIFHNGEPAFSFCYFTSMDSALTCFNLHLCTACVAHINLKASEFLKKPSVNLKIYLLFFLFWKEL